MTNELSNGERYEPRPDYAMELLHALPDFAHDLAVDPYRISEATAQGLRPDGLDMRSLPGAYVMYKRAQDGNILRIAEAMNPPDEMALSVALAHDQDPQDSDDSVEYGRSLLGAGYMLSIKNGQGNHLKLTGMIDHKNSLSRKVVKEPAFIEYIIGALKDGTPLEPDSPEVERLEKTQTFHMIAANPAETQILVADHAAVGWLERAAARLEANQDAA